MSDRPTKLTRRELLLNPFKRLRGEDLDEPVAYTALGGKPSGQVKEKPAQATISPEDAAVHLQAANKAYDAEDWGEAVKEYREFLRGEPENQRARRRLGVALYRIRQFVQVKVELERVLRAAADDMQSRLFLGLALLRMNKKDKALAAWKEYFEPERIEVQREVNTQVAFMETEDGAEDAPDADGEESPDKDEAAGSDDEKEA